MPDAMMNGGFAPYLAQAFTPQGVPGGLFGSGVGNVPGNIFGNPTFGQNYGLTGGGVPSFTGMPAIGQQFQPSIGWQQQLPQFSQLSPFSQFAGQGNAGLGWPNAQVQPWGQVLPWQNIGQIGTHQLGQPFAQPAAGWHEPLVLVQLLRQYAVPISAAIASPYGQAQIAQNIAQTAEMLARVLPVVCAQQQFHAQPNVGWQQQLMPQLPVASLLGTNQQYGLQQTPLGSVGGLYGQGQLRQFSAQSADTLGRILPYLAQQGLAGQAYGVART